MSRYDQEQAEHVSTDLARVLLLYATMLNRQALALGLVIFTGSAVQRKLAWLDGPLLAASPRTVAMEHFSVILPGALQLGDRGIPRACELVE